MNEKPANPAEIKKIKLTGLAPASLMKKYFLDGAAQDIWWIVQDLGYLTYHASQAYAQGKVTGKKGETFSAADSASTPSATTAKLSSGPL